MNNNYLSPRSAASLDALRTRVSLRLTACLTERTAELPQDITERLRFAREKALERARAARKAEAPATATVSLGSVLALGGGSDGWWMKLASLLPLIALVGGLVLIEQWHRGSQIAAAAEIDASLLSDDLPPSAYSDPGFVEFLKAPRD
jgi:uncharacterized protein DUF3619